MDLFVERCGEQKMNRLHLCSEIQQNKTTVLIIVSSVGMYALSGCTNLISISIPESVVAEAFEYCANLKYVAAPAHIVNSPGDVFKYCRKLNDGKKGNLRLSLM